jgi:hypothetical protein
MEEMDQIAAYSATGGEDTNKTVTKAVVGVTKAVVGTAASQAMGFIPVVGPVLAGVAGALSGAVGKSGQQMQQQNTVMQAHQRKQHLLALYDDKKCSAPSPSSQP